LNMRLMIVLLASIACAPLARADINVKNCVAEPGTTDMAYGDLVNCEIDPVSDSDLFRFSGLAGDKIELYVLRYSGNANQCVRIIAPGASPGDYTCVGSSFGNRFATLGVSATLAASGIHTIQVADGGADEVMDYGLALFRIVPPPSGIPSIGQFGDISSGNVTPRGDMDFFRFTGTSGDRCP
jgi:hypothetical protein